MPCCDDEEHSPSEFYCHGETNDPNLDRNATCQGENNAKQINSSENVASIAFTTLTLMASFCMERLLFVKKFTLYFRRLNFFFWSIVIVLLLQQVNCQKPPVYTAESCSNESLFWVFLYKVRTNCDPTKPYNKSLINFVCSVCTGKYCLRFLSHTRPRSFVARSVRKPLRQYFPVQTSHSVNKSLILLTILCQITH